MKPVYSLILPDNSTLEISHDELRSLLGEIENELHRSKVYRRAMAILQKMLGDSTEQAKQLFKVVGREAIGLTFQRFVQHPGRSSEHTSAPTIGEVKSTNTDTQEVSEVNKTNSPNQSDLSDCLTSPKFQTINPLTNPVNHERIPAEPQKSSPLQWFKTTKKPSKAELEQQAAIARSESLRNIGKQLQAARESQGLSFNQLQVYTHIPIHQMEAIEKGDWDKLPEEVFVRGFIRIMGNSLGLNGTHLAASLPHSQPQNAIAVFNPNDKASGLNIDINPMHLYFGYTAVVASAVGGLSLVSQYTEAQKLINPELDASKAPTLKQSIKDNQTNTKPGLQSNSHGITVGNDISPPEAL